MPDQFIRHDPPLSDLFGLFKRTVHALVVDGGVSDELCTELHTWEGTTSFPLVASWCRRLLRDYVKDERHDLAGALLESFGTTFPGNVVGYIGQDLLVAPLRSSNPLYRASAVNVLAQWLEDDEYGIFAEEAARFLDCEPHEDLQKLLWETLGNQTVEDFRDPGKRMTARDNPLLEEFLEIHDAADIELRLVVPTDRLPESLENTLGMSPRLTLALLESVRTAHICVPELENLGVCLNWKSDAVVLRVWDPKQNYAMSLQAADEDRWLVLAYYN